MNKSYHDLVAEAKTHVREVTPNEVMAMRRAGESVTLIDVRDSNEVNLGTIPNAVHVSRGNLEKLIEGVAPRDARVVVFCATGSRSALAAESLGRMGYRDVASMRGGIRDWADAGGDVE
jgi:rhodanese-related sulfurtransferase